MAPELKECPLKLTCSLAAAAAAVSMALAVPAASASPAPAAAWQPVVSGNPARIGWYDTISQPADISGVFAELPPRQIPAAGLGTLSWNASSHTLSWRNGPAVRVSPAVSASYTLRQPHQARTAATAISVAVTAGMLPAASVSDTLTVTRAPAAAGFGDLFRDTARGSALFRGNLYLGFEVSGPAPLHVGEVWRTADGVNWVQAAPAGFSATSGVEHVDAFIVFGGQLYAGTDNGEVWRTADGTLWTQVPSPSANNENVSDFAIYRGQLYANQAADGHPAGVFRTPDAVSWSNVFTYPASQPQLEYSEYLAQFRGSLFSEVGSYKGFLGTGPGDLASSRNGVSWQALAQPGFGDPANTDISGFSVFGNQLYVGTFNATEGAQVWRTANGRSWQQAASGGFGDPANTVVHELVTYRGQLYAGTENDTEGGQIWRTSDGTHWTLAAAPGFGMPASQVMRMRSFFTLGGHLYVNAENDCEGAPSTCQHRGWELWRLK